MTLNTCRGLLNLNNIITTYLNTNLLSCVVNVDKNNSINGEFWIRKIIIKSLIAKFKLPTAKNPSINAKFGFIKTISLPSHASLFNACTRETKCGCICVTHIRTTAIARNGSWVSTAPTNVASLLRRNASA